MKQKGFYDREKVRNSQTDALNRFVVVYVQYVPGRALNTVLVNQVQRDHHKWAALGPAAVDISESNGGFFGKESGAPGLRKCCVCMFARVGFRLSTVRSPLAAYAPLVFCRTCAGDIGGKNGVCVCVTQGAVGRWSAARGTRKSIKGAQTSVARRKSAWNARSIALFSLLFLLVV